MNLPWSSSKDNVFSTMTTASFIISMSSKQLPRRFSYSLGNNQKSQGESSGLSGGWATVLISIPVNKGLSFCSSLSTHFVQTFQMFKSTWLILCKFPAQTAFNVIINMQQSSSRKLQISSSGNDALMFLCLAHLLHLSPWNSCTRPYNLIHKQTGVIHKFLQNFCPV